ncbi:MAG TPA: RNA polymerase sigma factor [Anaerolineaceae bacterium]|nr:RNA polymerase sigma factor [Anaerolineaceae bacterium]
MPKTIASVPKTAAPVPLSSEEDLVVRYYPAVYRLAYSILGDAEDASDAAQECFIAAVRAQAKYRQEASLKTWLFAIAINACRGALRKRKVRQGFAQAWSSIQALVTGEPTPEEQALNLERDRLLWSAVDRLDDQHRIPVILRYVHGCSVAEIARILGIQEGTVHSRLHYARHRLWEQLHATDLFSMNGQEERP